MCHLIVASRRFVILAIVVASLAVWSIPPATASIMQLTLSEPGYTTHTFTDSSSPGMISVPYNTVVGNWTIDELSVYTDPILGLTIGVTDEVYIFGPSFTASSGHAAALTVTATETFPAFPTANNFILTLNTTVPGVPTETGDVNGSQIDGPLTSSATHSTTIPGPTAQFTLTDTLVLTADGGSLEAANGQA